MGKRLPRQFLVQSNNFFSRKNCAREVSWWNTTGKPSRLRNLAKECWPPAIGWKLSKSSREVDEFESRAVGLRGRD